jgi:hypothetical protein
MFATAFTFLKTAIASKATVAFKASLKTSVIIATFALFFICLVCPVLVILLVLIKVIIQNKSSDKELL